MVRKALKQSGVSPKVLAGALVGIAVFALTKLGVSLDPILEQAINVAAIVLAAIIAPPGDVVVTPEPLEDVPVDEVA